MVDEPECGNCLWFDPATHKCRDHDSEYSKEVRKEWDEPCKQWLAWDIYEHEVRQP